MFEDLAVRGMAIELERWSLRFATSYGRPYHVMPRLCGEGFTYSLTLDFSCRNVENALFYFFDWKAHPLDGSQMGGW